MASAKLTALLSFLSDIPRYRTEKPFYELRRPPAGFDYETATEAELESLAKKDNLEFSEQDVPIGNIRGREANFRLETCGFEIVHHASRLTDRLMMSAEAIQAYKNETEELLQKRLTGPSTWRGLIPEIEDNPLAVCDYRTVDNGDLIAGDRLIPTRIGEIYYVRHNRNQKWYWLEKMKPDEPFLMIMYDSDGGKGALLCPHISFQNPEAPETAQERVSIETRTIVITRREEERLLSDHISSC
ncbi:hypothetical protein CMQ_6640 [Grosmannia clavigera kw1407]|uniref:Uncharacterized protein n=1 Tax=Grosmannia clavigera (strain kw1407 / UAMH 11150) TaxID=655863 RepID=F0X7K0_GROCL|nr:uncharacterized protein CMQ_6640 [Grosmannia clavigera kw1407]EFX06319.1 hypothetical protein CMQ_6640 [Grosmannia clavigera kw1407]